MQWITGIPAHNENQPKRDLLAMTETDRETLTEQIKECLEQRVRKAKLYRATYAWRYGR